MSKKNMSIYKINALATNANTTEILIYGNIGEYDYWSDAYSNDAQSIIAQLDKITTPNIDVRINSYGGNAVEGLAIFNALDRHPATVNVYIDGAAISAAADIAMVGKKVVMAANAMMMLHGSSTYANGNAMDHRETADILEKYNAARATNYAAKTGKTVEEILAIFNDGKDHFYTAQEALDAGFIDQIGDASPAVTAQFRNTIQAKYHQAPTAWFNPPEGKQTMPAPNPVETETQPDNEAARQQGIKAVFELVSNKPERAHIHAMQESMLLDTKVTPEKARELILAELGKNQEPASQRSVHIEAGKTGREKFIEAATNAILIRAGFNAPANSANNEMLGWRLDRIAEECLVNAHLSISNDRMMMIGAAFTQSTSDFPVILENAMHKTLLMGYENAQTTWRTICKTGSVSDFLEHGRYRKGTFGVLDSVGENGEVKTKNISDGQVAKVSADTKGNIINLTRKMIINDDLGAFLDIASDLGMAVDDTIEDDVYQLLLSNPTMSDGFALFSTEHKNVGTSSVASVTSISEARKLMMSHKKISSDKKAGFLRIMPNTFLSGFNQADNARVVNTSKMDPDVANKAGRENIRQGTFTNVIDSPYFEDNQWYIFADPVRYPVIEVVFLNGVQTPRIEIQQGWTVDGTGYRVMMDHGVGAIDFRGAVKNAGA